MAHLAPRLKTLARTPLQGHELADWYFELQPPSSRVGRQLKEACKKSRREIERERERERERETNLWDLCDAAHHHSISFNCVRRFQRALGKARIGMNRYVSWPSCAVNCRDEQCLHFITSHFTLLHFTSLHSTSGPYIWFADRGLASHEVVGAIELEPSHAIPAPAILPAAEGKSTGASLASSLAKAGGRARFLGDHGHLGSSDGLAF